MISDLLMLISPKRSFTCVVSQPKCLCIISSSIRARKKNFSATHRKSILCLSDEDDGRVLAVGGCGRRRLGRWRACRGGRRGGGARSGWDSVRGDGRGRCRSRRQDSSRVGGRWWRGIGVRLDSCRRRGLCIDRWARDGSRVRDSVSQSDHHT